MTPKLQYDRLIGIGRMIVENNEAVITEAFAEGVSEGMTRGELAQMLTGIFADALQIEVANGPRGTRLYRRLADAGRLNYIYGEAIDLDCRAIVEANYLAFSQVLLPKAKPEVRARADRAKRVTVNCTKPKAKTKTEPKAKSAASAQRKPRAGTSKPKTKTTKPRSKGVRR